MNPTLLEKTYRTWANSFKLPFELHARPGTTIRPDETRTESSFSVLWPFGKRVVFEFPPYLLDRVHRVTASFPPDHRMTGDDLKRILSPDEFEHVGNKMYVVDPAEFRPVVPDAPYHARQLTPEDHPAIADLLTRCSEEDRDEADIHLDYRAAFGVFEGERMVSVACSYLWRGFVETGVLTDPAHRGKSLGRAVVSACYRHHLSVDADRVVIYRHDVKNVGSQKIAEGLGFAPYDVIEAAWKRR